MNTTTARRRTRLRTLPALAAGSVLAGLVAVVPTPAAHASAQDSLTFGSDGSTSGSYAGNGMVIVDGSIRYENDCARLAARNTYENDWIYPATDVYIIPTGSVQYGQELRDAGGEGPNTIVGIGSGAFLGELIAVTTPTGTLGDGDFDVVFDTCQDGMVDTADTIFSNVIHVDVLDGQVPPVDPSIRRLKDAAREEYASWLRTHMALTMLFKLDDAKAIVNCLLAPNPACLLEVLAVIQDVDHSRAPFEDWVEGIVLGEVMQTAKKWGAIWKDPADPEFRRLPELTEPGTPEVPAAGRPVADALGALAEPLGREAVLAEQLLHALERYQGAQEAGDADWALVQARAVRDVADTLGAHLAESTAAEDLQAEMTPRIDQLVAAAEEGEDAVRRIQTQGLDPDEQRRLVNQGLTWAQVASVERAYVAEGSLRAPDPAVLRDTLADLVAARAETRAALEETVAGWTDLVDALESSGEDLFPHATAGGPYRTDADGGVRLDATASQAGRDGARITTATWDLDGDGDYDDASGFAVDASVATTRTVAIRVEDESGRASVDLAHVSRTSGDRPPVVSAATPDPAVTVEAGASRTFAVTATDPDGDALSYEWTHRGEVLAGEHGATLTLGPTAADLGAGGLTVRVTGRQRSAVHTWMLTVVGPDVDGDGWSDGPDCDDERAGVHPRAFERIGNDRDDDCDADTPDAPVGGLSGRLVAWGHPSGVGLPIRSPGDLPYYAPVNVPSLGDRVRSIASLYRGGFAVDVDGAVWGWGENFNGRIGDGTDTKRWSPVPVLGVGGEAGTQLTSVREVTGEGTHTLARLTNDRVVAWGSNLNQQLGTGDDATERHSPRFVVDAAGEPVTDVVQVETGENGSFAVLADGRVMDWGVVACDDSFDHTKRGVAAVNSRLGEGVVQIASGDGGGVYVLRDDGSVWSCGGYDDGLGRPYTQNDQNELRPVSNLVDGIIDVEMGNGTGAALDEDGGVWLWGRNTNHELDVLGVPPGGVQKLPMQVALPTGPPVVDVEIESAGTLHATRADGSVLVWGSNTNGSAGNGRTESVLNPKIQQVSLGDVVPLSVRNSIWNGLALVRPKADPDFEPAVQWVSAAVADATVDEATGGVASLTLSEPAPVELTVDYRVGEQSVRQAIVPTGATSVALPVSVVDDAVDEDDEVLALSILSVSRGVRLDRATGTVTVVDDDAAPVVSVGSRTLTEGNTSLTDVAVPVRLDAVSGKDVEVLWTAREGGTEVGHGHVLLPIGEREVEVHVQVAGGTTPGPDRTVVIELSDPVDARLGGAGTITLNDDDPLRLTVTAPTVTEGDSGTTPAVFGVRADVLPAGETLDVPWALTEGTAAVGEDLVDASGSLSFDADHPVREAVVPVVADTRAEPLSEEVFGISLADGPLTTSAGRPVLVLEVPSGVVTDDDTGPTVDAGTPLVLDEGGSVAISGTASAPATWSVTGGGCMVATPGALDTTLSCTTSGEAELTLTADDGVNEPASATVAVTVRNVAPTVRITSPAPGAVLPLGEALHLTAVATDPGDPVTCTVTWGDGTAPEVVPACAGDHEYAAAGAYTVAVTASDGESSETTAGVQVTVEQATTPEFPFDGFFAPVDNPDVVNVVKAGATVPVKFSLGGHRGLDIFAAGSPASASHACGSGDPGDVLEQTASPGAATLTYDAASGRYQFNWQTKKAWSGSCRTLVVELADGRVRTAEFRFR